MITAKNWLRKNQSNLQTFVVNIGDTRALRKHMPQAARVPRQCAPLKSQFQLNKGIGRLFLKIKDSIHLFKQPPRSSWRICYDIAIKKNGIQMALYIGIQLIQHWWKNLAIKWRKLLAARFAPSNPEGSNKKRSEGCMNSKNQVTHVRAIQGHTGGSMMSPELMRHVEIPYNWKKFTFHMECSYDLNSFMDQGLIAVGREKEEDKWFFSRLSIHLEKIWWGSIGSIPHGTHKSTLSQFLNRQTGCGVMCEFSSSTRSRFTTLENEVWCNCCRWSCASKLHLQSHLVKKRTHLIWESANSKTCNESDSQKQVVCWARTGLWRSLYRCVEEVERYPVTESRRRHEDRNIGRTVWNRLLEAACRHWRFQVWSWSSNSRSTRRGRTTGWELHEGNQW